MKNYQVITEIVPRLISTDEDWEEIERMKRVNKANVVFIDSLSRLYEGGIEDSGLAKKVSLKLRVLSNKLQITLIVIHHTPKQIGIQIGISKRTVNYQLFCLLQRFNAETYPHLIYTLAMLDYFK